MAKRIQIRVQGRVQGVSYRDATRVEAERLGLTGWVRNLQDGAVVLEAQGDDDRLSALEAWCRVGPPSARVEAVEVAELPQRDEDEREFVVQHDIEPP
ncbi:MAG: acylphosphatase [Deltaproteobacteria bacterium]|nr:acylphosphatase [Deltaproteobacteria bacterium]